MQRIQGWSKETSFQLGRLATAGMIFALAMILGLVASNTTAEAQSIKTLASPSPLVVWVVDQNYGPIAGAWLEAYSNEGVSFVARTFTNSDGVATLDIAPGIYTVVSGSAEYKSFAVSQHVVSPGFVTLKLSDASDLERFSSRLLKKGV